MHAVDRGDDLSAAVQSVDAIVHLAATLVFLSYPGAAPDSSNEYLRTKGEAEALLRAR